MKQPVRQPKQSKKQGKQAAARARVQQREQRSSFEPFLRLDKSAVLILLLVFCLIHWAIRVLIAPVYTIEEADQLLLSQSLQIGYEARQPPMLAWLHALAIMAGGISPLVIFGLKYFLLFIGLAFYYLAARNVLIRPGVSAAAVGAWGLTFQVGWAAHEDLLQGVALMACLSLAFHAITRILTWRRYRDWVYLGVAMGIGLLTHHLFIVFPVAMVLAIFFSPFFRDAVTPGRLGIMLLIAVIMYAPYAVWVVTHVGSIGDAWREYADSWEIDNAWIERVGNAAAQLGRTMLEFTLPLLLFWMMLFWTLWLPIIYPVFARRNTDEEPHELSWRKMFARAMLFAAIAYLVSVVLGVQTYKDYWMMPVLFTGPVWLFSHVKRAGEFPVAIRAFAAVVIAFALLVIGGRFVEWQLEITTCEESCRPYTPVEEWAKSLKNEFEGGTIVGADRHLTGNLRAAFPRARVLDASIGPEAFPLPQGFGNCLVVWRDFRFDDQRRTAIMPPELVDYLKKLNAPPRDVGAESAVSGRLRMSEDRTATLYYRLQRQGAGDCR